MTDIREKWFGGVDLGYLGLVTPGVSGLHSLPDDEIVRTWVDGSSDPSDVVVRTSLIPVRFSCIVDGGTHEALCAKLRTLRGHMRPSLGWVELRVPSEHPGLRTFARSQGFPVEIDALPYLQTAVEFTWSLERRHWWEDASPTTVTIAGLTGEVTNSGTEPAPALYTCTVSGALAGLSFAVGEETFQYSSGLVPGDVLMVRVSQPRDVTRNGTRDFAGVEPGSRYPLLRPGTNAIVKSSADYSLAVSFRRRSA